MLVHAVQVLPNLRKASILRDLQLDRDLHVGGRRHADIYTALPLYYSSGREQHFSSDLVFYFLPAEVANTDVPVLLTLPKSIPDVVKIPRGHYQHLLVAEVDHLRITRGGLEDLLEFLDVGVELLLEFEVVGNGFVGLVVGGEGEEVFEGVQLALLIAVQLQRVGRVGLGAADLSWKLEDAPQLGQFVPEELEVRMLLANHIRELLPFLLLLLLVRNRLCLLLVAVIEKGGEFVGN